MIKRRYNYFLLLFLIFSVASKLLAQTPNTWQYTDIEGLPSMNIYNILQDDEGLIWLATENGICYFDGDQFTMVNSPEMRDKDFIGMMKTSIGQLFVWNWGGQLFEIKNKKPILQVPDSLNMIIKDVISIGPNKLLVLLMSRTDKKIRAIKNQQISVEEVRPYYKIESFLDSLVQANKGKNINILSAGYFNLQGNFVNKKGYEVANFIYSLQWGWMYSIAGSSSLMRLISQKDKTFTTKPHIELPNNSSVIRTVYDDRQGNMWILTNNLLYICDTNKVVRQANLPALKKTIVNCFFQDKNGGYWAGTNGEGLYYIPNYDFKTYNSTNIDIKTDNILNLLDGRKPHMTLASTASDEIIELDSFDQVKSIKRLDGGLRKLFRGYNKSGFWGFFQKGTYFIENDFSVQPQRYDWDAIKTIFEKDDTTIFLGTSSSGARYTRASSQLNYPEFYPKRDHKDWIFFEKTYSFAPYKENEILVGTLKGLFILNEKNKTTSPFTLEGKDSLALKNRWIQDIFVDNQQRVWLATQNNGVYLIEKNRIIQHWKVDSGLLSDNCNQFIFYENTLWFRSTKGVHGIDVNDFSIQIIFRADGLPSNIISSFYINEYTRKMWVGSPKGMTVFGLDLVKKRKKIMPVIFTSISLADQDTTIQDIYRVAYNDNTIQINFTSPNFIKNDLVYFYRLKGLDNNWVQTTNKALRFPKLPAGQYTFEIYAQNIQGEKSEINTDLRLVILKPYWQTWWYYLLMILTSILLIGGLTNQIFRRTRRIREQRLKFQNQIMSSRMQALQSQMNPHFIFNALNAIQHFFTIGDKENAILHLNKFAKLIRLIFEYSKETFITMEQEIKFLNLYLKMEQLRFNGKISIQLDIDPTIDLENYEIPPLLIQPMIENAFKHGLLHKEKNGILSIELKKISEQKIYCRIDDNGIGRAAAKDLNHWRPSEYRSSGLKNTQERITLINQDEESLYIKMNIEDKNIATHQELGTIVEFYFLFNDLKG